MKRFFPFVAILFCGFITADNFSALSALVGGTWKMKTANSYSCEQWVKVSGNELSSIAFDVKGKDTTVLERVRLVNKGGIISYNVTGAKSGDKTSFKLKSAKNNQYIFEDQTHDFPQRVIYHFIKPDSIHAWVDGKFKGKYEKIDYYYKRVR
ncbi:DUF6265 family protein [Mucilaginibacter calamicampi]|uniref:DUF6265 family protein n=1 Tax=Mucilaginibacter calamicampi TaxID=1302352 RepID=A0ABW2YY37_9SPHI